MTRDMMVTTDTDSGRQCGCDQPWPHIGNFFVWIKTQAVFIIAGGIPLID